MKPSYIFTIFYLLFIVSLFLHILTRNPLYFYLGVLPFIITGFGFYYREKGKLEIVTTKILNLLKLETLFYWLSFLLMFILIFINRDGTITFSKYPYVPFIFIFILFSIYAVISIKRKALVKKLLHESLKNQLKVSKKKSAR